ncbi:MAG: hypothetical protein ACRENH_11550 [Gemmatimonadaceae bacterium]
MAGLFLVTWLLGGAGAVVGSMLGGAFGDHPLFIGALLGGALAIVGAVRLAEWRKWIPRTSRGRVAAGAILAFLVAAAIAARTLSSPIGPVLSSLLIGVGAVVAAKR